MKLSKTALRILTNQYSAVLMACLMGMLVSAQAGATVTITNPNTGAEGEQVQVTMASDGSSVAAESEIYTAGEVDAAISDNNTVLLGNGGVSGSIANALGGSDSETLKATIEGIADTQADAAISDNNTVLLGNGGVSGSIANALGGSDSETLKATIEGIADTQITSALGTSGAITNAISSATEDFVTETDLATALDDKQAKLDAGTEDISVNDITASGDITANGDISAEGAIAGDSLDVAKGIKAGTDDAFQVSESGAITKVASITSQGDITANGDISAEGAITGDSLDVAKGIKAGTDDAFQVSEDGAISGASLKLGTSDPVVTAIDDGTVGLTSSTANDETLATTATVFTAVSDVETKLGAGASGYDIDAKSLKVQGNDVLTEADIAANFHFDPESEDDLIDQLADYVYSDGAKLATIGQTVNLVGTTFTDQLGYEIAAGHAGLVDSLDALSEDSADKTMVGAINTNTAGLENLAAQVGVTYTASTGEVSQPEYSSNNVVEDGYTLVAAVSGIDEKIGAIPATTITNNISSSDTISKNLTDLDAAIGSNATLVAGDNVVDTTTNVSSAVKQLDDAIGNRIVEDGNYIQKSETNSVNANISALDSAIGAQIAEDGHNIKKSEEHTVNQNISALDSAIGKRTKLGSANAAVNAGTNTSVAAGLKAAGDSIGSMDFVNTRYITSATNLTSANRMLDSNLNRVEGRVDNLDRKVDKMDDRMNSGFASLAAMSGLQPNARAFNDTQISIGTGTYRGEVGYALGAFHYFNDNVMMNVGASYAGNNSATFKGGVTFGW